MFQRWLGRLSVRRKLTLIYLLDLSAVIYVSSILIYEKNQAIDFTRKEILGTAYTQTVRQALMQSLQASQARANLPAAPEGWAALRAQADPALTSAKHADDFDRQRAHLAQCQDPLDCAEHRHLIAAARTLITTVGNQSNLILDPDLDSYYSMSLTVLRFPELLDVLVEAGSAVLNKQRAAASTQALASTRLLIVAGRLDAVRQGIASDFQQAYAAGGPGFQREWQSTEQALGHEVDRLLALLQGLAERPVTPSDASMTLNWQHQAEVALDRAWVQGLNSLDGLLKRRVDGLFARMWLHLGTALALLLCILTLVYTVARLIARPLQHLSTVADAVRQTSNYNLRAHWQSQDEIGRLVAAFNTMLGQLDCDRVTREELVASARATQAQLSLLESIPIAMVVTSVPDHRVLHANAPAQPWLMGRIQDPWARGLEPAVRLRFFQHLHDHDQVDEFEVRWLGGAEPAWAVLSARRLHFQGADAVLTTFTPINVIKLMEQRLELWAKVFEASAEGILIMNDEQRVISTNQAFGRVTGYEFYEVAGESFGALLADQQSGQEGQSLAEGVLICSIEAALKDRGEWQGEVAMLRRSGEVFPAWLMVSAVRERARSGAMSHVVALFIDITDRKRAEDRVRYLARHDVLTELPNRAHCEEVLTQAVAQAAQTGECLAVLFVDLDRFKLINDTLGHHVGDALLRSVAQRLRQAVRAQDMVSRLGGDEFVIILRDVKSAEQVRQRVEERLIPLMRLPHVCGEHTLKVSCSVGIAVYPQDGVTLQDLMRRSDAAMYEAKTGGRDAAKLFDPQHDQVLRERQQLEQLLASALERKQFQLVFQPRVRARGHGLLGVEALIRWHSPELGLVNPARFIPLAEDLGLIGAMGAWVMQAACEQWAAWAGAGLDLQMSVNLSAAQLADRQLVTSVQTILAQCHMPANRLELELTESLLMKDPQAAARTLQALKDLGVQLAIDDFGTGYSSLAYLRRFAIDQLKVDQSFVSEMMNDPASLAIVRATVALGHSLGLSLVAEGVETAAQAQVLAQLGVEELQGYHFGRPVSASDASWHPVARAQGQGGAGQ